VSFAARAADRAVELCWIDYVIHPELIPCGSESRVTEVTLIIFAVCQNRNLKKLEELYVDTQHALKLLHRYHDATNAGRLDEFDDLFADDFINFAAGFEPVKSLAAMKMLIQELLLAFPDWHVTVEDMFAQDNKVVTRWSLNATHLAPYYDIPATGLKIRAEGIHIDHIVDGKIANLWACNNFTETFTKLRAHAGK
jgi:steroid delta-isomerase-like uncharacterized protein